MSKFKQTNTSSKFNLPYSKFYLPVLLMACLGAVIYRERLQFGFNPNLFLPKNLDSSSFFTFTSNEAFILMLVVLGISTALSCIMLQVTIDFLTIVYGIWKSVWFQTYMNFLSWIYPTILFALNNHPDDGQIPPKLPRYWIREGFRCMFGGKNKRVRSSAGNAKRKVAMPLGLKGGSPSPKTQPNKLFSKYLHTITPEKNNHTQFHQFAASTTRMNNVNRLEQTINNLPSEASRYESWCTS